jgi:hypothetical protein
LGEAKVMGDHVYRSRLLAIAGRMKADLTTEVGSLNAECYQPVHKSMNVNEQEDLNAMN